MNTLNTYIDEGFNQYNKMALKSKKIGSLY